MKSIPLKFEQSAHKGSSDYSANVRLVNCYSAPDPGGRVGSALVPVPGSAKVLDVSPGVGTGCRGAFRASTGPESSGYLSTLYFVFGNTVFRYNRAGAAVKVGTFNSSNVSGTCTFAENQGQTSADVWIYVCDRQTVYKFKAKAEDTDVAQSWQELANLPNRPDADVPVIPSYISWGDYRLIMAVEDSNVWFYTETGTDTFRNTNTYFGESSADKTVRVVAHGGALWSFGAYSYDVFTRTGNRQNPYSNPKGASGKVGLASAESLAVSDDLLFWLGQGVSANNGVYMANRAGAVKRISDAGLEEIIRRWKYQEHAYGFAYVDRGQTFYCLTSQMDDMTLCYNASTEKWHQASTSADGREHSWDISYPVSGYGPDEILFGCRSVNAIAAFDREKMVDYAGRPVTRVWQSPVLTQDLRRFRVLKTIVDVETGTSESYARDAKMWVQFSLDGGATWRERVDRTLGVKGQYGHTVQVIGGGMPRDLVLRIGTSDIVPLKMFQIRMDVEEMAR